MKRFAEIITPVVIPKSAGRDAFRLPALQQQLEAKEIEKLVAESNLHLWSPGQEISKDGIRLLIGIMTASQYDLVFLDILNLAFESQRLQIGRVDVFSCQGFSSLERFEPYYPERTEFMRTPTIGIWLNGTFTSIKDGPAGREGLLNQHGLIWPKL